MTSTERKAKQPPAKPSCPICGKPVGPNHKPFCSKRCADVDLHRWLSNSYSIAGAPREEDPAGDESE